jgi:hypothetical protein
MAKNPMTTVLPLAGAGAGAAMGGPMGAGIGMAAGGALSGLFDNSDEDILRLLEQNRAIYGAIDTPNHVWKDLAPDLYSNESANYELIGEDPMIRSRQMDHLAELAGLSQRGLSDVDNAVFDQARRSGNQMARAGREAAMQDAANRGVAGSGLEFATREIANQAGAERANQAALAQAAESARQRALYTTAYGGALGAVRGQDLNANQANTDIINRFNMANTTQRNATNNANVDLRNQYARDNQQGQINTSQQNFNNQMARAGGMTGANTAIANAYGAQSAANQSTANMWTGIGAQAAIAGMYPNNPQQAPAPVQRKRTTVGEGYQDVSGYV